ncbi:hypothetical protein PF005_g9707 [Phytophthora fragariae]|uniref:Uncharacterized protein n=1 Tax=Phytophthora fragariae TaxID=53985 RepID=A0A6A3Y9U4_9STRA|nr:hypothetical protein PF005_g9707 [Phytophthora fragariae]
MRRCFLAAGRAKVLLVSTVDPIATSPSSSTDAECLAAPPLAAGAFSFSSASARTTKSLSSCGCFFCMWLRTATLGPFWKGMVVLHRRQ